jgi:hypothetical protein
MSQALVGAMILHLATPDVTDDQLLEPLLRLL